MKSLMLMLAMLIGITLNAQDISREEWRNMSRQERKAYKEQQAIQDKERISGLILSKQWVLEAHTLNDRYGESYFIEPNLNFVGVVDDQATIQLGDSQEIGYNGVGGITLDGTVRKYEVDLGRKPASPVSLRLEVSGAVAGHVTMMITAGGDGNATALVTNMYGDRLTYRGQIVSLAESRAYKGISLP